MPSDATSRLHPQRPIVGVGVVVWRGDSVLLVRRGKEPNKGQWSIPGGAQQLGETVFAAAAREVQEETGLEVEVRALVDVVDGIMQEAGRVVYHYTLVDVVAESLEGEPVAADDAAAVGWFTLEELPALQLWSETERIIRESVARLEQQGR
jgi:ADP-ribose pyrophosphatase YjhB (NUDIX family)